MTAIELVGQPESAEAVARWLPGRTVRWTSADLAAGALLVVAGDGVAVSEEQPPSVSSADDRAAWFDSVMREIQPDRIILMPYTD